MKKFILFSSFFLFSFISGLIGVINHGSKSVVACVYGPSGECVDTWYVRDDNCDWYYPGCWTDVDKCDWYYWSGGSDCSVVQQVPCEEICG